MVERSVSQWIHSIAEGVTSSVEQAGVFDANPVPRSWTHVTKLDPEPAKRLPILYPAYLAHTDAVSVGGSTGVTATTTEETFDLLEFASVPAIHEPSAPRHVTDTTLSESAFLAVPEVLNGTSEALVGTLGEAIEGLREDLIATQLDDHLPSWLSDVIRPYVTPVLSAQVLNRALFEAYIIQNPDSAAAREAGVTDADVLSPTAARQRAVTADCHLRSEIIYVEYSGTYGGEAATDVIEAVAPALNWARLWYGGGLRTREHARAVRAAGADAVVVGDVFHDIADEEVDLYRRLDAESSVGAEPTTARIEAWLDDTITVADTAAAQYLSTTAVDAPVDRARTLLATGLALCRRLETALASDASSPSRVRRQLDTSLDAVVDSPPDRSFLTALASGVLAPDTPSALPVTHLSIGAMDWSA
ncbi:geranylgeranylglyceryl/heptaprenylglyceryl phosphate synthase [Haloplanus aerogenes]|uniref:phosphoglycerol geranylgeranyltransferase n=1 Tax=Haloplanus aerogenes TaxID=660522 RepID=A0A3M0DTZ0_9EURY|nr:geranylgeranylglyceryl/heptaprenylglyceryl phosphate synthase [Haloplanus aerogenes]AZH25796.1 oxidoreductase [Haloplanus aerogenes]RMB25534.1 phosphoglycerol geranylgeranyltransferase [Haloplanus aerogenes]